jgi:hypothetical protein
VSETNSGDGDAVAEPTSSDEVVEASEVVAETTGSEVADTAGVVAESTARKARVRATSKAVESGRATPKGGANVRQPVSSGRYTPPIPRQQRHSPRWFPVVLLGFLVLGLLLIVLNYVNVLPGGTNNWYLIAGIGAIVTGLFMATFYH